MFSDFGVPPHFTREALKENSRGGYYPPAFFHNLKTTQNSNYITIEIYTISATKKCNPFGLHFFFIYLISLFLVVLFNFGG